MRNILLFPDLELIMSYLSSIRTVMFFVPKPQHANMLIAYLNRMLTAKAKTSWRMEQIG